MNELIHNNSQGNVSAPCSRTPSPGSSSSNCSGINQGLDVPVMRKNNFFMEALIKPDNDETRKMRKVASAFWERNLEHAIPFSDTQVQPNPFMFRPHPYFPRPKTTGLFSNLDLAMMEQAKILQEMANRKEVLLNALASKREPEKPSEPSKTPLWALLHLKEQEQKRWVAFQKEHEIQPIKSKGEKGKDLEKTIKTKIVLQKAGRGEVLTKDETELYNRHHNNLSAQLSRSKKHLREKEIERRQKFLEAEKTRLQNVCAQVAQFALSITDGRSEEIFHILDSEADE